MCDYTSTGKQTTRDATVINYAAMGITTSNTPVPVKIGRPTTMLLDGVVRSSKSPCSVASDKNAVVVSYEAFRSGDGLVESPFLLKGL